MGLQVEKMALKIVLANIWSDKNLGDHFIARGIAQMITDTGIDIVIEGMSMFGPNEAIALSSEYHLLGNILSKINANPIRSSIYDGTKEDKLWKVKQVISVFSAYFLLLPGPFNLHRNNSQTTNSSNLLKEANLLIYTGGNYLTTKYGPKQLFELLRLLYPAFAMARGQKHYILLGESIFGLDSHVSRKLLKKALGGSDLLVVREEDSMIYLEKNKLYDNPICLPDMAIYLGRTIKIDQAKLESKLFPILGVSVRPWNFWNEADQSAREERFRSELVDALVRFSTRRNAKIILVPWTVGPMSGEDDRKETDKVYSKLISAGLSSEKVEIARHPSNLEEFVELYSQFDANLSVRLHSAIMASLLGIPSVMVEYQGSKTKGTSRYVGLTDMVLHIDTATSQQLSEKLDLIFENYEETKLRVKKSVEAAFNELEKFRDQQLAPYFKALLGD